MSFLHYENLVALWERLLNDVIPPNSDDQTERVLKREVKEKYLSRSVVVGVVDFGSVQEATHRFEQEFFFHFLEVNAEHMEEMIVEGHNSSHS